MNWKPPTIDNLVEAQRIFISVGNDSEKIHSAEYIEKNYGYSRKSLEEDARKAVKNLKENTTGEYEIIFDLPCSIRCRMYIYPSCEFITREFPGSEYCIGISHMNHFQESEEEVERTFSRIEKKLIEYGFPARNI